MNNQVIELIQNALSEYAPAWQFSVSRSQGLSFRHSSPFTHTEYTFLVLPFDSLTGVEREVRRRANHFDPNEYARMTLSTIVKDPQLYSNMETEAILRGSQRVDDAMQDLARALRKALDKQNNEDPETND